MNFVTVSEPLFMSDSFENLVCLSFFVLRVLFLRNLICKLGVSLKSSCQRLLVVVSLENYLYGKLFVSEKSHLLDRDWI